MENFDITLAQNFAYILAAILFITGIKMLGKEATAQRGNVISAIGMFVAIIVTAINIVNPFVVLGGIMLGAFQYFFFKHGVFWESVRGIWIHGAMEIFGT